MRWPANTRLESSVASLNFRGERVKWCSLQIFEEQFQLLVELVQSWSMAEEVINFPDHLEIGEVVENCSNSLIEGVR